MTWAKDFYTPEFADLFLDAHPPTDQDIDFITSVCKLESGMHILDQCCGNGRISDFLIKRDYNVTGVDIINSYIVAARKKNPDADFFCKDARSFSTDQKYDAVVNWWTSFGYGETVKDDQKMIAAAFDSLKENGFYILDIPNAEYCRNSFSTDKKTSHTQNINGTTITWESWLSPDCDKVIKSWEYKKENGQRKKHIGGGIRLYTAKEITALFEGCGFYVTSIYGDTDKSAFKPDSRRCIVIGQKPKAFFKSSMPPMSKDFRHSIYNGDIYKLSANSISENFVSSLGAEIKNIFGDKASRLHEMGDHATALQKLNGLKDSLRYDNEYHITLRAMLLCMGLTPSEYAIDYPRLRVNIPSGYKNEIAKPAYSAHRDTWYCNPQNQINVWIPIFDCNERQSFAFYPDYFTKPVQNNSADFDYRKWIDGGYPLANESLKSPQNFRAKAGEIILFSAAHLHQGLKHDEDTVRYSIDFRIVHLDDYEDGIGAPNVDNNSRPYAMIDYLENGL